jgi:hypothetical protein
MLPCLKLIYQILLIYQNFYFNFLFNLFVLNSTK